MEAINPFDKPKVILTACSLSMCGVLLPNLFPVILGSLGNDYGFSNTALGDLTSATFIGFTIPTITSLFWIKSVSWRLLGGLGALILALCLFIAATQTTFNLLFLCFLLAGAGGGILYTLAMAVCGESTNKDRVFGIKLALETAPGAVGLILIPLFVSSQFGFSGIANVLAVTTILFCIPAFILPKNGVVEETSSTSEVESISLRNISRRLVFFGILASFFLNLGFWGTWGLLERVGIEHGVDPAIIGNTLAVSLILSATGGLVAGFLGDRFGRMTPATIGVITYVLGIYFITRQASSLDFFIGGALFGLPFNFLLAYFFGATATADLERKLYLLSAAACGIGAIVGPPIAGRLYDTFNSDIMLLFSGVTAIVSLLFYMIIAKSLSKVKE